MTRKKKAPKENKGDAGARTCMIEEVDPALEDPQLLDAISVVGDVLSHSRDLYQAVGDLHGCISLSVFSFDSIWRTILGSREKNKDALAYALNPSHGQSKTSKPNNTAETVWYFTILHKWFSSSDWQS